MDVFDAYKAATEHYRLRLQRESYVKVDADGTAAIIVGTENTANYLLRRTPGGAWSAKGLTRSHHVVDAAEEHCYETGDVFTVIPPLQEVNDASRTS